MIVEQDNPMRFFSTQSNYLEESFNNLCVKYTSSIVQEQNIAMTC